MVNVSVTLMKAGFTTASEHIAIRDGARRQIQFDAMFARIEHPQHGTILFDTGYSRRFYEETRTFPKRIYALATPVHVTKEVEAIAQLSADGVSPGQVRHIIVSHFHADHIGGLKDFPEARFYCSGKATDFVRNAPTLKALRHGVLKGLIPNDFLERMTTVHYSNEKDSMWNGQSYDLFGDGTIRLVAMGGHAVGQIGAILRTASGTVFLISDACWLSRAYREFILPKSIVRLFFHSWSEYKSTLRKLHEFYLANPNVTLVPSHCKETVDTIIESGRIE